MRGRRVRDATNKERQVCARARVGVRSVSSFVRAGEVHAMPNAVSRERPVSWVRRHCPARTPLEGFATSSPYGILTRPSPDDSGPSCDGFFGISSADCSDASDSLPG